MSDPTKVLDSLQSLAETPERPIDRVLNFGWDAGRFEALRVSVNAAKTPVAKPPGAMVDHLRRIQSRGPGPKAMELGSYQVEVVHHELEYLPARLRVWRDAHIIAEVELPISG